MLPALETAWSAVPVGWALAYHVLAARTLQMIDLQATLNSICRNLLRRLARPAKQSAGSPEGRPD